MRPHWLHRKVTTDLPLTAGKRGDLISFLAGALYPFAFAPFSLFPLALLSLAVLFLSLLSIAPSRVFWRSWLFGVASFGVGVSWVFVSIHNFGGVGVAVGVAITMLFVVFLALFPATVCALFTRLFQIAQSSPRWLLLLLVLPAAWLMGEWLRSWFLTGFPWLLLGYSQVNTPLAGLAPLIGGFGLSLVGALSAGLLAMIWLESKGRYRPYLLSLLLIWAVSGLLTLVEWSESAGEPIQVSMVQGNIPQEIKWLPEQRGPTLERYGRLTREHWQSDLIIWPETAVPMFYQQASPYFSQLSREAKEHGATIILGVPVSGSEPGSYYNSMITLGEEEALYHKRHLVPFGEYLPMAMVLGWVMDILKIPMADFSAGSWQQQPLSAAGYHIGMAICYEIAYGREMIDWMPEANMLIHASNNAWFGDSLAPHQHLEIAQMRALEISRPVLSVSNDGITALIDHRGEVYQQIPRYKTMVLSGEVQPTQGVTPYMVVGDWLAVSLAALMAIFAFVWLRRNS